MTVPGTGPDVAVFDSGVCDGAVAADGEAWRADPGGSAVLYGMVATIAEVLERLEARLDRIEVCVARPDTSALEARVAAVADAVASAPTPVVDLDALAAMVAERLAPGTAIRPADSELPVVLDDLVGRLGQVESSVQAARADGEAAAARLTSELQALLGAGMERLLTHATAADEALGADLRASFHRTAEMASTVHAVHDTLQTLGEQLARLAADERGRPVLEALEAIGRQHQEAVFTLQTALVRRIDGRTAALARLMEGRDDRSASVQLLERLGTELGEEHRRLEAVLGLCQSVATAVEQQAAVGGRVAELVLETRTAMRSDVERVESAVQLEAVKSRQQDQARLTQVAAGVTEVVERETALVAQRVAALANTVDAVRAALHAHVAHVEASTD